MALALPHIQLIADLRAANLVGAGRTESVLEFGEQNWFGDVHPEELRRLINRHCGNPAERGKLQADLDTCLRQPAMERLFGLAKIFYRALLEFKEYVAVDLHGTEKALKLDLNSPISLGRQFHLVTNLGTGEHVFNQYQFYRSVHEYTRPGGLMLHHLPNQGSYDHGFYNYHPTFLIDLCSANRYEVLVLAYLDVSGQSAVLRRLRAREDYVRMAVEGRLGIHSALLALVQKPDKEEPFRAPLQGYYDNQLSPQLREAWQKMPR